MLQAVNEASEIDFSADADIWTEELNSLTAGQPYDIVIRGEERLLYSSSVEFGLRQRPEQGVAIAQGEAGIAPDNLRPRGQEAIRVFPTRNLGELEQIEEGLYFGKATGMSGIEMMVCSKELENGVTVMLTQAAEPINQSIAQANILLAGCTLLALGISAVFVFKISKRFTKPITQIQSSVGSIAALDFGCKCDIRTGDELQSLGEDVNRLSGKLKSALDTLRLQNGQLEKDIAAQRQFISNASHELRTPLALIKGYAEEINAGFADGQRDMYIGIITEEAAKMNRLLKEMLELTRMESGMARLQNEKLSVNESIQTFLEKYDGFISSNGLNVSLRFGEDADGFFDPVRFEQVLANYISNAARYGDGEKQVEISTNLQGDSIRISVFNTGKPIPEDILENIWDGFYKADAARTREEDSYGLGLSVVKAIQNAAQQGYGVYNSENGVVFWFEVARFIK
jgi:signal transduction histidine kinase